MHLDFASTAHKEYPGTDHNFSTDCYHANRGLPPFILHPFTPRDSDNMCRYPIAIISLLMLIVTFNDPGSNWPFDIGAFDYRLQGNLLYWLFSFSTTAYIPLMIASAILFIVDLAVLVRNKTSKNHFQPIVFFNNKFLSSV